MAQAKRGPSKLRLQSVTHTVDELVGRKYRSIGTRTLCADLELSPFVHERPQRIALTTSHAVQEALAQFGYVRADVLAAQAVVQRMTTTTTLHQARVGGGGGATHDMDNDGHLYHNAIVAIE